MRFLVHVIDNASQHIKSGSDFSVELGIGEDPDKECHVLKTDVYYAVKAESPVDAVTIISNIVKIEKENETVPLSSAILETQKEFQNMEFNGGENILLTDIKNKQLENPYGDFFDARCQIKRHDKNGEWIEVHRIQFYVVEESKIIEIRHEP